MVKLLHDSTISIVIGSSLLQYSSTPTQTWHSHMCLLQRLGLFLSSLASWLWVQESVSDSLHMADDTRETCQITQVESHCVNYRVTLRVSCCGWLRETLGMHFFSSQTTQFMQVLISDRHVHAVIRSTCAQLLCFGQQWHVLYILVTVLG